MEEALAINPRQQEDGLPGVQIQRKKKEVFPALTGLRMIAAYLVFFHHYRIQALVVPGFDIQREMHIGVPVFFVLSGFLICYRYFDNITWQGSWFRQYFKNRFARIYPVYFLLCIGSFAAGKYFGIKNAILNVTLTHAFFSDVPRVISPSWSLTVEECFYASAPFIFFFGKKWLIIPYVFFVLLLGVIVGINDGVVFSSDFLKGDTYVLLYTFFGRFTEFFAGILLGKLVLSGKLKLERKTIRYTISGIAGIIAILVTMAMARPADMDYGLNTPYGLVANNILLPVFVALLIYGLIAERTLFSKWLALPFIVLLGKSSYAFYLVHKSFIYGYAATIAAVLHMPNLLFCFIFLNLLSIALYKYFEHPVNKWIRKL